MAADGVAQLRAISARLKTAADGAVIKRAMVRDIRSAAVPVRSALREAARDKLPRSGGLNERVAKSRMTVSVTTGAKKAGVRIVDKQHDAVTSDSGYVRHPVYGNRSTWVEQQIPEAAGWWTDTAKRVGPSVTPAVLATMRQVARDIERGGV